MDFTAFTRSYSSNTFSLHSLICDLQQRVRVLTAGMQPSPRVTGHTVAPCDVYGDAQRASDNLVSVVQLFTAHHPVHCIDISQQQLSAETRRTELMITLLSRTGFIAFTHSQPYNANIWEERVNDLYGSHRIVRTLDGSVAIRQSPWQGSALEIFIPFERVLINDPDRSSSQLPHILLAEDDATNAWVVKEMLLSLGCQVTLARDGQEAVDLAAEDFDLILMDCQMPRMDGLQATRAIRAAEQRDCRPRTPIVALTAYIGRDTERACEQAGMTDFITKPVTLAVLQHQLARHLDGNANDQPSPLS